MEEYLITTQTKRKVLNWWISKKFHKSVVIWEASFSHFGESCETESDIW